MENKINNGTSYNPPRIGRVDGHDFDEYWWKLAQISNQGIKSRIMTLYFRYEAYVPIFCQLLTRQKNLQLNNQLPGCAHRGSEKSC